MVLRISHADKGESWMTALKANVLNFTRIRIQSLYKILLKLLQLLQKGRQLSWDVASHIQLSAHSTAGIERPQRKERATERVCEQLKPLCTVRAQLFFACSKVVSQLWTRTNDVASSCLTHYCREERKTTTFRARRIVYRTLSRLVCTLIIFSLSDITCVTHKYTPNLFFGEFCRLTWKICEGCVWYY